MSHGTEASLPSGFPVLAALALITGTALLGVPVHGALAGHDADFAIAALARLQREWSAPGFPPAWLTEMQGGFGGPLFQFYPPLAYLLALGLARLLALDAATAVALTAGLARLAALGTCFLWLRRGVSARSAWLGAATYVLLPFTGLIDPVIRFPFAELVATGLLPLLPIAIGWRHDGPGGGCGLRIALIGGAVGLLVLTNVPVAVTAGVTAGLYALALGGAPLLAETALGGALGIALAAWHLLPALLGTGEINLAAMMDEGHHWTGTMLLSGTIPRARPDLFWAMLHGCFGLYALGACAYLRLALRPFATGHERASLAACLGALAFCTPLTWPAWRWIGMLDYVQFPWRFLLPATLFAAALAATLVERRPPLRRRVALATCLAGLAGPLTVLAVHGLAPPAGAVRLLPGPARTERALAAPDPLEYVPAAAQAAGWLPWLREGHPPSGVSPEPAVVNGEVRELHEGRPDGSVRVTGEALGPAKIMLSQFWYPGWRVVGVDGQEGAAPAPSATGLVELSVPPGRFDLILTRGPLPGAGQGRAISAAALVAAAAIAWHGLRRSGRRTRPAGQSRRLQRASPRARDGAARG